jgi:hypothetical protein
LYFDVKDNNFEVFTETTNNKKTTIDTTTFTKKDIDTITIDKKVSDITINSKLNNPIVFQQIITLHLKNEYLKQIYGDSAPNLHSDYEKIKKYCIPFIDNILNKASREPSDSITVFEIDEPNNGTYHEHVRAINFELNVVNRLSTILFATPNLVREKIKLVVNNKLVMYKDFNWDDNIDTLTSVADEVLKLFYNNNHVRPNATAKNDEYVSIKSYLSDQRVTGNNRIEIIVLKYMFATFDDYISTNINVLDSLINKYSFLHVFFFFKYNIFVINDNNIINLDEELYNTAKKKNYYYEKDIEQLKTIKRLNDEKKRIIEENDTEKYKQHKQKMATMVKKINETKKKLCALGLMQCENETYLNSSLSFAREAQQYVLNELHKLRTTITMHLYKKGPDESEFNKKKKIIQNIQKQINADNTTDSDSDTKRVINILNNSKELEKIKEKTTKRIELEKQKKELEKKKEELEKEKEELQKKKEELEKLEKEKEKLEKEKEELEKKEEKLEENKEEILEYLENDLKNIPKEYKEIEKKKEELEKEIEKKEEEIKKEIEKEEEEFKKKVTLICLENELNKIREQYEECKKEGEEIKKNELNEKQILINKLDEQFNEYNSKDLLKYRFIHLISTNAHNIIKYSSNEVRLGHLMYPLIYPDSNEIIRNDYDELFEKRNFNNFVNTEDIIYLKNTGLLLKDIVHIFSDNFNVDLGSISSTIKNISSNNVDIKNGETQKLVSIIRDAIEPLELLEFLINKNDIMDTFNKILEQENINNEKYSCTSSILNSDGNVNKENNFKLFSTEEKLFLPEEKILLNEQSGLSGLIMRILKSMLTKISDMVPSINDVVNKMRDTSTNSINGLVDYLNNKRKDAIQFATNTASNIQSYGFIPTFDNVFKKIKETGSDILDKQTDKETDEQKNKNYVNIFNIRETINNIIDNSIETITNIAYDKSLKDNISASNTIKDLNQYFISDNEEKIIKNILKKMLVKYFKNISNYSPLKLIKNIKTIYNIYLELEIIYISNTNQLNKLFDINPLKINNDTIQKILNMKIKDINLFIWLLKEIIVSKEGALFKVINLEKIMNEFGISTNYNFMLQCKDFIFDNKMDLYTQNNYYVVDKDKMLYKKIEDDNYLELENLSKSHNVPIINTKNIHEKNIFFNSQNNSNDVYEDTQDKQNQKKKIDNKTIKLYTYECDTIVKNSNSITITDNLKNEITDNLKNEITDNLKNDDIVLVFTNKALVFTDGGSEAHNRHELIKELSDMSEYKIKDDTAPNMNTLLRDEIPIITFAQEHILSNININSLNIYYLNKKNYEIFFDNSSANGSDVDNFYGDEYRDNVIYSYFLDSKNSNVETKDNNTNDEHKLKRVFIKGERIEIKNTDKILDDLESIYEKYLEILKNKSSADKIKFKEFNGFIMHQLKDWTELKKKMNNDPLKLIAYFFIIIVINYLGDDIIKPYIDAYYDKMNNNNDASKLCKMVFSMNQYAKYYSIMHKNQMNDIKIMKDKTTEKNELKKLLYLEEDNKKFILNNSENDVDEFKSKLKNGFDTIINNLLNFSTPERRTNITVDDISKNNQVDSKSKLLNYKLDTNNEKKIENTFNTVKGGKKKKKKNILISMKINRNKMNTNKKTRKMKYTYKKTSNG